VPSSSLLVRTAGSEPPADIGRRLEDARRARDEAEKALARQSAQFRAERQAADAGYDEVACQLGPREELLAYVRINLKAGAPRVDEAVERWRTAVVARPQGLRQSRTTLERDSRAAGAALRAIVWDPIAAGLHDVEALFLVPDGALHLVNFAALPSGADRYLDEGPPVINVGSSAGRDWVTARGRSLRSCARFRARTWFCPRSTDANCACAAWCDPTHRRQLSLAAWGWICPAGSNRPGASKCSANFASPIL